MADNQKIFIGNGKATRVAGLVNFSLCVSDIPKEHITTSTKNGKKYLNLTIGENRGGANQYGTTHSIWINTWKPDPNWKAKQQQQTQEPAASSMEYPDDQVHPDDIPF